MGFRQQIIWFVDYLRQELRRKILDMRLLVSEPRKGRRSFVPNARGLNVKRCD
jgi:hypothetical protein